MPATTLPATADRATEAEDIAARIEQDIQLGSFAPGSWLKQIDLERRYGCSRAAVRQALERLVVRHLVRHEPNCGYRVDSFDPQMLHDLSQVRALLEVAAAEQILPLFRPSHAPELRRLARRFEAAVQTGTLAEQHAANMAFHQALLRHCPNRELVSLIVALRERVPLAVQQRKNPPARMQASARDHFAMIVALQAGDLAALRRVTRDHVLEPEAPVRARRE